jgi:group II intron reverse transcriptase/maturase
LYLLAYGRIYSNKGAMTPGPDAETADGMTLSKIERIIDALRHERYRFKPVKRHYIPKKDGKQRPLGLPSWSDKLVGEVVRLLLEAYYEPQFSDHSHGYRPGRGCHTALSDVAINWTGTTWFIEGDISHCFDELDHSVMLQTLGEKIHDNRLLRLTSQMLSAGYLEDWVWNATLSGAPQGGVLSPCLSNIYLDRLDTFVETVLMPGYTRGVRRKPNPAYNSVRSAHHSARKRGERTAARALRKQQRSLPVKDPRDPDYRRLRYVRYADDRVPRTLKEDRCRRRFRRMRCCTRDEGAGLEGLVALRGRPAGGGRKPPRGAPVKSRGAERRGKGVLSARQVWITKASASDTADEVSKAYGRHQNRGRVVAPGSAWRKPADWPGGARHEGGASVVLALVRNEGTCRPAPAGGLWRTFWPAVVRGSENPKQQICEGESSDAGHRGGPDRSSDEGPVMGLERRGRVVLVSLAANRLRVGGVG